MREAAIQKIVKTLTALILFSFAFLIYAQADKKFTLDELDFPIVAKATSETGVPIYYRGEETPRHLGLYHPPLYIYALAAQIKLFGFSENTVRAFGMACTMLTAYLALGIIRLLDEKAKNHLLTPIFLACYLLNPYTIANSTLPDIDSTILPPLITLFILFLFENKKPFLLGFIFSLLLWAKLTTPLVLIPFSILYWKFDNTPVKKVLIRTFLVFGGGTIAFFSTYWIYCKFLGLPIDYTFSFLIHSFTKGSASPDFSSLVVKIFSNFSQTKNLLISIGLPSIFLFLIAITFISAKGLHSIQKKKIIFLLSLCVTVTIFYCSLISPFGGFFKYPFPVFQLACIGISIFIFKCSEQIEIKNSIKFIALVTAIFILTATQALKFTEWATLKIKQAEPSTYLIFFAICIFYGLILTLKHKNRIIEALPKLTIILFISALGINFGVARYQAISAFPTKYSYGQMGMNETIAYLRANLKKDEIIWSMKDIGFYAGNRYIENYDFFYNPDPDKRILSAIHSGVRFFVSTQGIGEDRIDVYTNVREALEACCRLDKNFGNFYIYVPK